MEERFEPSEVVSRVLKEAGLPEAFAIAGAANVKNFENEFLTELDAIARLESGDRGGVKAFAGNYYFSAKGVLADLVVLGLHVAVIVMGPTPVEKAASAVGVVESLKDLRGLIIRLDDVERLVCRAVLAVTKDKKIIAEPGASEEEIREDFKKRGEMCPQKLPDILEQLAQKERKILKKTYYRDSGPFYQVIF